MSFSQAAVLTEPPPENLDAYLDLSREEIGRLVLCLLIEEALRRRLAEYRERSGQLQDGGSRVAEQDGPHPSRVA
jgi:hypothetical protein